MALDGNERKFLRSLVMSQLEHFRKDRKIQGFIDVTWLDSEKKYEDFLEGLLEKL